MNFSNNKCVLFQILWKAQEITQNKYSVHHNMKPLKASILSFAKPPQRDLKIHSLVKHFFLEKPLPSVFPDDLPSKFSEANTGTTKLLLILILLWQLSLLTANTQWETLPLLILPPSWKFSDAMAIYLVFHSDRTVVCMLWVYIIRE